MNIRELQYALGHLHIDTTMRYLRLFLPADAVSPLDAWAQPPEMPPEPKPDPAVPSAPADPANAPRPSSRPWFGALFRPRARGDPA